METCKTQIYQVKTAYDGEKKILAAQNKCNDSLSHCGLVAPYGDTGWGNGLLPDGTRSLPDLIITSTTVICVIHPSPILQKVLMNLIVQGQWVYLQL